MLLVAPISCLINDFVINFLLFFLGKCYHISSLSEIKAEKIINSDQAGLIQHTRHQLVRIYPKGARTDSSNYDPIPFWNAGCQVVALNYQTSGLQKSINDALFQVNGNCGYVLKPPTLRNAGTLLKNK